MTSQQKIAVAGATGRAGRHVVDVLTERGHEVVPISRSAGVDIFTGEGLVEALAGVDIVIDVSSTPSPDEAEAIAFFTAAARNLHEAGSAAGLQRIVAASIIGIDSSKGGYNLAKVRHEEALLAGPVPVQILRAAQFHEFVEQLVGWSRQGDACYVPKMRTQLVSARAVAEALVDLAEKPLPESIGTPYPEIAGPREENLAAMAALVFAKRGENVTVVEVVDATCNPDAELFANGTLLPSPHATLAGPTYAAWLATSS